MNVTHAALSAIFMNLRTTFNNTFDAVQTNYQKIAMTVPSTGGYVKYDWLGKFPKMERWVGKKEIKKLENYSYTIVNENFAATVDGSEYDCASVTVNAQHSWKPVNTMNRDMRVRKKARSNKSWTLSVSVVIPDGADTISWSDLSDARITIESAEGGFRETYIDCSATDSSASYTVDGETRRDVNMFAMDYVEESV